jgi:hypothetical protein
MTTTTKPPYISTLRPIEELVDPEMREIRRVFDRMMAKVHSMTPEEFIEYQIECGVCNPDGTFKWPEGEPIGMLDFDR